MDPDSFGEAVKQWEIVQSLNAKKSTVRFYKFAVKIIRDNWPEWSKPTDLVTTTDVLQFAVKVAHYSPSYWNTFCAVIRHVVPKHRDLMKRREIRFRSKTPPNQQEFAALLKACDESTRSQVGLVVRFLALTGMRIGQAKSIRWEHVHEEQGFIDVPGQKNGEPHQVPIIGSLPSVLARLRQFDFKGYVLPRAKIRKALNNACERAGVRRFTPHSFRHFFATACIQSGVDFPIVADWLCHKDRGVTAAKFYFHLTTPHSKAMAKKVKIDT